MRAAARRGLAAIAASIAALAVSQGSVAAATGALTISPSPGTNVNAAAVETPSACSTGATHIQTRLEGAGFQDSSLDPAHEGAGYNISSNALLGSIPDNAAGGKKVELLQTFQSAAESQSPPAPLTGIHTLTTRCKNGPASSTIYDAYSIRINFTSPMVYVVLTDSVAEQPSGGSTGASGQVPPSSGSPSATDAGAGSSSGPPVGAAAPAGTASAGGLTPAPSSQASAAGPSAGQSSSTAGVPGSVSPEVRALGQPGNVNNANSGLPRTGRSIGSMLGYSGLLIAVGALAVAYARRRGLLTFGRN